MATTLPPRACRRAALLGLLGVLSAGAAWAARADEPNPKAFFKPELYISTSSVELSEALPRLTNRAAWEGFLARRGEDVKQPRTRVWIDPRSGAAVNILLSEPILPGSGDGNRLTLRDLARVLPAGAREVTPSAVGTLVRQYVVDHRDLMGIDAQQLGNAVADQVTPGLWQVSLPQQFQGVPVRYGRVLATITKGNLVLLGAETWGDVRGLTVQPRIAAAQALQAAYTHLQASAGDLQMIRAPRLEIVPMAPLELQDGEAYGGPIGAGYRHRLAWTYVVKEPGEIPEYEAIVDADTGEMLSFQDTVEYVQRQITGGVYPFTNTGSCTDPADCGTMQAGTPMPFVDTGLPAPNNFTNSAGVFDWTDGPVSTTLTGRFLDVNDTCGTISESVATGGSLNLGGLNGQHDCTSVGASPGNTQASRTVYYDVNRMQEMARGWLPNNAWLGRRLTANVNLNQTCTAFFNGSINFFRSGAGCGNTGEIAAVMDHEWGHGMDANDTGGRSSNSGEAYADIASQVRGQNSCIGTGLWVTRDLGCGRASNGQMNGNMADVGPSHCMIDCSGKRETDWAQHADGRPDTPLNFVCTSCNSGGGPCGREVHCASAPTTQSVWDLAVRDLRAAPFNMDPQTAWIVASRLYFVGSGNVGAWHSCTCGGSSSGCAAANGYMQWLAADDDNGNLADGTPHMGALFNAFNRHAIACATPAVRNSGCAGGPTAAPNLTVTPGSFQNTLSWTAVPGAQRYWVFKTEGPAGCNFGKTRIAAVPAPGTTFTDTLVANGRRYSYNVMAVGASDACFGPASTCVQATPGAVANPDFTVVCSPSNLTTSPGGSVTSTCTVASVNGFSSAVGLSCAGQPAGVTCSFSPAAVTPPANRAATSELTVSVPANATTGASSFQVRGTSGALIRTATINLQVNAAPDFRVTVAPAALTIQQGESGQATATVASLNGFSGTVGLSCANLPAGVACAFIPTSVTPPLNGSANSNLTVSVAADTVAGRSTFEVQGTSGAVVRTATVSLTITPAGGGGDSIVFADNFTDDRGWVRNPSGTDTATTGLWERADPEETVSGGTSLQIDALSATNDLVTGAAAGASAGANDVDGGVTSIQSPDISLPSTRPLILTFGSYLATLANAGADDFLRVTIVGSTRQVVLDRPGTGVIVPGAWVETRADISAFAGQVVRILVEAADAGTGSLVEAGVDNVLIVAPREVFFDGFETDRGWTRNPDGSNTATTGLWERGVPQTTLSGATTLQIPAFEGTNDLVTGAAAGANAGANDIDGGVTSILSPPIPLPSSGSLSLTFAAYLAALANATADDFLRVTIVGTPNLVVFERRGTGAIVPGAWIDNTVDISVFAGQTIQILVEAADNGTGSLVEAGVDNVRIIQQ